MSNPPSSQDPTKKPTVLTPESPRPESPTEDPALLATSPTASENSMRPSPPRQSLAAATRHRLVKQASSRDILKAFAVEEIKCFWANTVVRLTPEKGDTVHFGQRIARKWRDRQPKGAAVLMEDHEGKNGVLKLDNIEVDQTLDGHTKTAICAAQSRSFAESAIGTIMVSVKGASPSSFFRKVELGILLDNKNVKDVVIASIDDPEGKKHPKNQAYEILRDEWLESSIDRYQKAVAKKESDPKAYEYESKLLAQEMVLAEQRRKELFVDTKTNIASIEKEEERIRSVAPLIISSSEGDKVLVRALEKEESEHGLSDLDRIVSKLSKKTTFKKLPQPLSDISNRTFESPSRATSPSLKQSPIRGNFNVQNPKLEELRKILDTSPQSPLTTPNSPGRISQSRTR